jgi:Fic family protein
VGPKRRSTRHVCDIIGHGVAFGEVLKLASYENLNISMDHVKQVHTLVLLGSIDGGVFRKEGDLAIISGTKVLLAMPDETDALVQQFLDWISSNTDLHPFVLAVSYHYIFVRIHPFSGWQRKVRQASFKFDPDEAWLPSNYCSCA